jgi:hypothetical protein
LLALFRLLGNCTEFTGGNADRIAAIRTQADLIMAAGERDIAQPEDLVALRAGFEALARHLPAQPDAAPAAPMTEAGR